MLDLWREGIDHRPNARSGQAEPVVVALLLIHTADRERAVGTTAAGSSRGMPATPSSCRARPKFSTSASLTAISPASSGHPPSTMVTWSHLLDAR